MSINWYPGHMHKATKEIRKILPSMDVIIEILDARIPFSSENPVIAALNSDKPRIKLLNKADLADPVVTGLWLNHFHQQKNIKAMAISCTEDSEKLHAIIDLCKKRVPGKGEGINRINALVAGIPNVGKSTLINMLAGRVVARSGNEPAVTRAQQKINLNNGIMLFDTPGILWPKIENENSGYRLAVTGAIRNTAISLDDIGFFAANFLIKNYPDHLAKRYQLEQVPETELALLEILGRQRGCLGGGGLVDLTKIAEIFLTEIRACKLGRLSFETPDLIEKELQETRLKAERKAAEKRVQKEKRKSAFKKKSVQK
ncbi:MAG: ribosome biogenesis GTPase YlqF [Pseudomonadales bacterium]|nr:ribosome biogenesis GTPase YlqF [Pseudomonadales bacterium]